MSQHGVTAGLAQEAVNLLQDAGLWDYAATLTAVSLKGQERAQALVRWAYHVLREEGNMWRAVGLLTDGGCLHEALQVSSKLVGQRLLQSSSTRQFCVGGRMTALSLR